MTRLLRLILAAAAVVAVVGGYAAASQAGNSPRSGALHVTKECSQYNGQAGSFCTITSSNLKAIDVGSRVIYAQAAGAAGLDSDLVLFTGPGNSAFGHVTLSFATLSGVLTFSGGTGQFRGFEASVIVTYNAATNLWYWDGTYNFNPPGH
ncbi:MAG: hypothetical protein ACTHNB_09295 [Gaiellaceae bacterium]